MFATRGRFGYLEGIRKTVQSCFTRCARRASGEAGPRLRRRVFRVEARPRCETPREASLTEQGPPR